MLRGGAKMPRVPARSGSVCSFHAFGWTLVMAVLLLGAPSTLHAQFTSVIEGRITDATDAAVPNAQVTIENPATGLKRIVQTSDVGYYRVASLPPGRFTVRVG